MDRPIARYTRLDSMMEYDGDREGVYWTKAQYKVVPRDSDVFMELRMTMNTNEQVNGETKIDARTDINGTLEALIRKANIVILDKRSGTGETIRAEMVRGSDPIERGDIVYVDADRVPARVRKYLGYEHPYTAVGIAMESNRHGVVLVRIS